MIKKLPKRRGYGKNRARTVNSDRASYTPVNLAQIEATFKAGETVSPETLTTHGLVTTRAGRAPLVKILARGTLTKKVVVENCTMSQAAKEAIEKAGGTVSA